MAMSNPHGAASPRQLSYRADLFKRAVAAGHDETELRRTLENGHTRAQVSGQIQFLIGLAGSSSGRPGLRTSSSGRRVNYGPRGYRSRGAGRCEDAPCCGCCD